MAKETSEKNIKDILDDLYKIDPFLEKYEESVKKAVKELLKSKPDVEIDDKFVMELRERISDKIEELKFHPQQKRASFWQIFFNQKFAYGFGGVLMLMLLVGLVFHFTNINTINVSHLGQQTTQSGFNKIALRDNAFGPLTVGNTQAVGGSESTQPSTDTSTKTSGTVSATGPATGLGGGGGTTYANNAPAAVPICDTGDCGTYYPPKYIYVGDQITLDQNQIEVLRKRNKIEYNGSIPGLLQSFGFGLADINGFEGARVQSVNLVQDKDFGYMIYINFDEGTISIDSYWPKWPRQQITDCKGEVCTMTLENWPNISEADVPTDKELISMANSFAANHGIDLSFYGQPEVMKDWISPIPMRTGEKVMQPYVSDTISIKYPLMINNKNVYDQSGSKFGLTIVVNIRWKKVSGVYNLYLQDYESSMYAAETDFSKILKIAEKGGIYGYYTEGAKTTDVEIGTPEQAYAVTWEYDQTTQTSKMLLIPALIFPITKSATNYYSYMTKIVIPLAKDLLEQSNVPVPVPLIREKTQ
jgi:hypothetical protein